MQSIILIGEAGLHLERLEARLPRVWLDSFVGHHSTSRGLCFEGLGHRWFIHIHEMSRPEEVEADYGTNDLLDLEFRESLGGRSFFSITFSNGAEGYTTLRALLPSLLRVFAKSLERCWIDNDYGVVIRGDRFLGKLEGDPSWDWRTAHP